MITVYQRTDGVLSVQADSQVLHHDTLWIDMFEPSLAEERQVETALSIAIPTREELNEIETSSRLYQENNTHFMTATIMVRVGTAQPERTIVTFILHHNRLVTLRYAESNSISQFVARLLRSKTPCGDATELAVGLLETITYRQADLIEQVQVETDQLAEKIFSESSDKNSDGGRFRDILHDIGKQGISASRARESLVSLGRLMTFFANAAVARQESEQIRARIRTVDRDIVALSQHVDFLSNKITFLLDATLGMITLEQNNVIKILSIAATVVLPPTLIATIYGMNFKHMPELEWAWAYPVAWLVMIVTAFAPLIYFLRKKWL